MKLETGQHVKCFLRSTMVLEGVVENWSDTEVVLKSLNGESLMIIHRPSEDIMITKVVLVEPQEIVETIPSKSADEKAPQEWLDQPSEWIKEKLAEVMNPTDNPDLDKMNVEQLRQLVHEQEKQMIAQKKKEHFGIPGSSKRVVTYSNPYTTKRLPNISFRKK